MSTTDDSKFNGWSLILNSVKTPLGFFTLLALILDGVLLITATVMDRLSFWAPLILLGLIVGGIFYILVSGKSAVLYDPRDWRTVIVTFRFPANPLTGLPPDLDVDKCEITVRNNRAEKKFGGRTTRPNLRKDVGGWTVKLQQEIEPDDSIEFILIDTDGKKWSVQPFAPFANVQEARLIA